jgi:hypothetical protein
MSEPGVRSTSTWEPGAPHVIGCVRIDWTSISKLMFRYLPLARLRFRRRPAVVVKDCAVKEWLTTAIVSSPILIVRCQDVPITGEIGLLPCCVGESWLLLVKGLICLAAVVRCT